MLFYVLKCKTIDIQPQVSLYTGYLQHALYFKLAINLRQVDVLEIGNASSTAEP